MKKRKKKEKVRRRERERGVSLSVGRKKKEERRECAAAAAAAAAVGDPHSLFSKVVTLPTSQPPMGWLKAWAPSNAAWGRDVIRTRAGNTPQEMKGKKEGKKKENMTK